MYHRDIKLENTLLEQEGSLRLKLCDFGYSKVRGCYVTSCAVLGWAELFIALCCAVLVRAARNGNMLGRFVCSRLRQIVAAACCCLGMFVALHCALSPL